MTDISEMASSCKWHAGRLTEAASAAYWLNEYAPDAAKYRLAEMREHFEKLASSLGYRIERITEEE